MTSEEKERWASRFKRPENIAENPIAQAAAREIAVESPFDPRIEISADARHIAGKIIKHLWIIFVLLPIVLVIAFEIVSAR